jgi:diguanylate cyclase (GGDEF)-like protein
MNHPTRDTSGRSPLRLLVILLLSVFAIEFGIMTLLLVLADHALNVWVEAALDAGLLSTLLFPVLFMFVFRPLVRQIKDIEQAEADLRAMGDRLELRVRERTVDLEQRNREISMLAEMSNFLQACATPQEAYRVVARAGQELFPGTSGALFVYSASRNDLEAQACWGDLILDSKERVFAPADCWALRHGREHRIEDSRTGLPCAHVPSAQSGNYLCVPMIAQGEVLGVMHLRHGSTRVEPTDSATPLNERLVATLTEYVALALINLKLRETLRNQAIRDPLTGLFNRRYMEESLALEVQRAERRHGALGVVMLDLDHFKHFNDSYGHEAGDQVLREVGALLNIRIRGGDIACRYGGEEFTLILPEMPLATVRQRVDALRLGISQFDMRHRGQSLGSITISAGIAMFPEHGTTGETLLDAADKALYRAKAEGRDRAVAAGAPAAGS